MKILIENYANPLSTEPQYLNRTINHTNTQSEIWNTNHLSVYDVMDLYNPDILICNHTCRSLSDVIKYFKNSNKELILNISGMRQNSLSIIENILSTNNIKCRLFISNNFEQINPLKSNAIKIINLLPSADIFIPIQHVPNFNIDAAIITTPAIDKTKLEEYINQYETLHKIVIQQTNEKISDLFDYGVDAINACSIYNKYNNLVLCLTNKMIFSQIFFDAYLRSNNVILQTDDKKITNEILQSLFENENKSSTFQSIKDQIKKRHTCVNRTIKLFRALELNDDVKILEKLQESI